MAKITKQIEVETKSHLEAVTYLYYSDVGSINPHCLYVRTIIQNADGTTPITVDIPVEEIDGTIKKASVKFTEEQRAILIEARNISYKVALNENSLVETPEEEAERLNPKVIVKEVVIDEVVKP